MTPVRSFYEWADSEGLLSTDVARRLTQVKYFAAGTAAGGEHGARRRVLADELRTANTASEAGAPEWISDPAARLALETIRLNARDRFLLDLMYYTGIRVGEALSIFVEDLHLGGGSVELDCRAIDPHFQAHAELRLTYERLIADAQKTTRQLAEARRLVEVLESDLAATRQAYSEDLERLSAGRENVVAFKRRPQEAAD
jgi:hypothetical protein